MPTYATIHEWTSQVMRIITSGPFNWTSRVIPACGWLKLNGFWVDWLWTLWSTGSLLVTLRTSPARAPNTRGAYTQPRWSSVAGFDEAGDFGNVPSRSTYALASPPSALRKTIS